MTNEELAVKVKGGDNDALLELWEQNKSLAYIFAKRRYSRLEANRNMRGVDMDDLVQAVFLALVDAVGYFDDKKEFPFTTYWGKCVQNELNSLLGVRTSKRDPLDLCISLDTPLDDSPDAETLEATIPDPDDRFTAAEDRVWQEQLHTAIENALSRLSSEQETVLRMHYYDELTYSEIQVRAGLSSRDKARHIEAGALRTLRRPENRSELEGFIDLRTNYYFTGNAARQERVTEITAMRREDLRRGYLRKLMNCCESGRLHTQEA